MHSNSDTPVLTPAAIEGDRSLALTRICLNFGARAERYRERFAQFLETHRVTLGLDGADDLPAAYLRRVWPDNLPGTFIVANITADAYGRWLIRPPAAGPLASSFAADGLAPAFRAYRRQGRFIVDGFEVVPHVQRRPFEVQVSAPVRINPTDEWMEADDFARLEALPRYRQRTEERLAAWRECLDWREKLLHLDQITLRYERRETDGDGRIRFFIRGQHDLRRLRRQIGPAFMLVAPLDASRSHDRWDPQARWGEAVREAVRTLSNDPRTRPYANVWARLLSASIPRPQDLPSFATWLEAHTELKPVLRSSFTRAAKRHAGKLKAEPRTARKCRGAVADRLRELWDELGLPHADLHALLSISQGGARASGKSAKCTRRAKTTSRTRRRS